jgi:hypothetical protein
MPWMVSFDPGVTTGYAEWDAHGGPLRHGQLSEDELFAYLDNLAEPPEILVIESFVLFGHKAKQLSGSDMKTSQVIGMIKTYAKKWKAEVIMQPAHIKRIAEKWSGAKPIGAHKNSHWVDAFNHGYYYLQKTGVLRSRALEQQ